MRVHVKDGTGAGTRTIRALEAWECRCGANPGHRYSCEKCGTRRPG